MSNYKDLSSEELKRTLAEKHAFLDISIAGTVCLNLVFSALAVLGGSAVGKYAADRCKRDYSWIGGALFVVLAFSKIL